MVLFKLSIESSLALHVVFLERKVLYLDIIYSLLFLLYGEV